MTELVVNFRYNELIDRSKAINFIRVVFISMINPNALYLKLHGKKKIMCVCHCNFRRGKVDRVKDEICINVEIRCLKISKLGAVAASDSSIHEDMKQTVNSFIYLKTKSTTFTQNHWNNLVLLL